MGSEPRLMLRRKLFKTAPLPDELCFGHIAIGTHFSFSPMAKNRMFEKITKGHYLVLVTTSHSRADEIKACSPFTRVYIG